MNNKMIRRAMRKYVKKYGERDTRKAISMFASAYHTTKQRISGNISCLCCLDGTVSIERNRSYSKMY